MLVLVPALLVTGCGDDNALEPDTTAPLAPNLKGAVSTGPVATIWWDTNTEPDLNGYNVYVTEGGTTSRVNTAPVVTNVATVNVADGSTVTVFVTAIDFSENESGPSNSRLVGQDVNDSLRETLDKIQ
jgi:hypothetical protein